jgi:hypothetical protein
MRIYCLKVSKFHNQTTDHTLNAQKTLHWSANELNSWFGYERITRSDTYPSQVFIDEWTLTAAMMKNLRKTLNLS